MASGMVKLCRDNGVISYVIWLPLVAKSSLLPADVLADNARPQRRGDALRVYVVDSAGFMMLPHDVSGYVSAIRARATSQSVFTGHNNLLWSDGECRRRHRRGRGPD